MPDEVVIEIEGADEFVVLMEKAPKIAAIFIRRAIDLAVKSIHDIVAPYPPQPDRDRAETFNTYVRGTGSFPRSAFVGGQRKKRGAYKGRVRYTSEKLGERWTTKVRVDRFDYIGIIGNSASYARYVQGDKQPYYHDDTGWVTLEDAAAREEGDIQDLFEWAVDQTAEAVEAQGTS